MLSTREHTEVICGKWNVMQNLLCILNSAERHFKSASFVFLRMDHDRIYWQWILNSLRSNTKGLITEPSEGNLEVKFITPISERQTRPKTLHALWENKLVFSGDGVLTERWHHAFRHCKNFSWLLLDPIILQNLVKGKCFPSPPQPTCKCSFPVALGYSLY